MMETVGRTAARDVDHVSFASWTDNFDEAFRDIEDRITSGMKVNLVFDHVVD